MNRNLRFHLYKFTSNRKFLHENHLSTGPAYLYNVLLAIPNRSQICLIDNDLSASKAFAIFLVSSGTGGLPPVRPLALADLRPACTLSLIRSRSNSANAPKIYGMSTDLQLWLYQFAQLTTENLAATISYVLEYNQRHPKKPIVNGATFGDFEKIRELVGAVGHGRCREIGAGVRRLSLKLGETDYAIQVKSLELPAYLPETNPGYVWSIAGGHVSMDTAQAYFNDGNTSLEYWVEAITTTGIVHVGYDMTGLCKFSGLPGSHEIIAEAIRAATGLDITQQDLEQAIRRAFFSGLALEKKQGFSDEDYTLPERVFNDPNPNILLPNFVTRSFFEQLKAAVWERITPEVERMEKSLGLRH